MKKAVEYLRECQDLEELVTDEELDRAWGFANFGGMTRREVIREGTLKCLVGYHQGWTSRTICQEVGLIDAKYRVTPKGKAYLWRACHRGVGV